MQFCISLRCLTLYVHRFIKGLFGSSHDPFAELRQHIPPNEEKLKLDYTQQGLDKDPDTFVLYRILGNDLPPRHIANQTLTNLEYILKNEPNLPDCEKRWVVNRIHCPEAEEKVVAMLERYNQSYIRIPFFWDEYQKIGWDFASLPEQGYLFSREFQELSGKQDNCIASIYRLKNNYVMNNNGARNAALQDGRGRAKWVLPWDGNCFVTRKAWESIRYMVTARPHIKYFMVPMSRLLDNKDTENEDLVPKAVEEPQVIFRSDSEETFNPEFAYGRCPKVELFWRLHVPGPWQSWREFPWDQKRRPLSPEAGQFALAGWVFRLYSGYAEYEQSHKTALKQRGKARQQSIFSAINALDQQVHSPWKADETKPAGLAIYSAEGLRSLKAALVDPDTKPELALAANIIAKAEAFLLRPPPAVTDKITLAPSGDIHDYWHPAPYWWPDPEKPDGLPYIRKDGQRVPGTTLYEPLSERYDRSSVQQVFDGVTTLVLAWYLTGRIEFARHAAAYVQRWFVDPGTIMNPHLKYAQVRMGRNKNEGAANGIIEFKDLYYFLDAMSLLAESGELTKGNLISFKKWLEDYRAWLLESPQGKSEVSSPNNHGIFFDLQMAAICYYLNDREEFFKVCLRALSRIPFHFTGQGEQPNELSRTDKDHYLVFNLQGWMQFLLLARNCGFVTPDFQEVYQPHIVAALAWVVDNLPPARLNDPLAQSVYHAARVLGLWKSDFPDIGFDHAGLWQDTVPFWQINACAKWGDSCD